MKSKVFEARANLYAGFVLCILAVSACWFFCMRHGMFGSKVDWISQHSVLPDYFRRQFYETGDLFPEFAANIGGGQNIYNLSYYGLYSPVVLLSYLLPFVKMPDYMMAAQIVSLAASGVMLHWWLLGRGFERKICFLTAVMFLLSGPMVFQSYNQIMFVNYMPFLCMGFLGADRYFDRGKSGLLTVSIFLMIMTSFYFSIGGMLALCLYGLYRYAGECREKQCLLMRFLIPFAAAVLMSGVLLVPTAAALMGRKGVSKGIDAASLFVPEISVGRFFYSPYGIGLTAFAAAALIGVMLFGRWRERLLAWGCALILTVPFFAYVLNGGLYVRDKVMIPFLPLLCYVAACYADHMSGPDEKRERGRKRFAGVIPYGLVLCILGVHFMRSGWGSFGKFLMADAGLTLVCYLLFSVRKNVLFLMLPPVILLALFGNTYHFQKDKYVSREFYEKVTDSSDAGLIREAVKAEKGFYRTEQLGTDNENAANLNRIWDMGQYVSSIYSSLYNDGYQQFRRRFGAEQPYRNFLMQPALKNPVYQRFMGVKYVAEDGKLRVNRLASPVVYATDRVMAASGYEKLKFPENQLALLDCAAVEGDEAIGENKNRQNIIPVPVSLPEEISSGKKKAVRVDIPESLSLDDEKNTGAERVLFLRFKIKNLQPSRDVTVWIEGQRGKLTARDHVYYNGNTVFTYAVPVKKGQGRAELIFGAGHYRVSDAECFLGTLPTEKEAKRLYQSELVPDKEATKGNVTGGSITVKKDGYLITTIPYDEGFKIFVDGQEAEIEKVNTAFLGCRIKTGGHEIKIVYHAPGAAAGKIVSAAGVLLFLGLMLREKTENQQSHSWKKLLALKCVLCYFKFMQNVCHGQPFCV